MKPAKSIIGLKVEMRGEVQCEVVGTDEGPKLKVNWSGPRRTGSIARYLNAGQTYSLVDTDPDDAYWKCYVVPDSEVNEEARRNGGSQIILAVDIDKKKPDEPPYLALDLDS